eukprot:GHVN01040432.1.p1 GENE.GHVN01040432.1~~GHVN01040432.1.p1  ORF type:complete len:380 (+),score=41.35 GHVN01040432.1:230-1369(+)
MAPRAKTSLMEKIMFVAKDPVISSFALLSLMCVGVLILLLTGFMTPLRSLLMIPGIVYSAKIRSGGNSIPVELCDQGRTLVKGKTVVITGGNTGLGLASAIELAKWQANIVLGCRDKSKAEAAMVEIRRAGGTKDDKAVRFIPLDLSDLESVKTFAKTINDEAIKVDVLMCNAGVGMPPFGKTKQGHETQWGTNVVGHLLLQLLLKSNLTQQEGRIVNTSSVGHVFCAFGRGIPKIDDIKNVKLETYDPLWFYAVSKLGNAYVTQQLDKALKDEAKEGEQKLHVYSLHPGAVRTELQRHQNKQAMYRYLNLLTNSIFFKSPLQGAQTQLFLTIAPKAMLSSGSYYTEVAKSDLLADVDDPELSKAMYDYAIASCEPFLN